MWLHVFFFFISILEMPSKSREQNTWIHLFFFGHTLIFNRLLGSNRSAAMKQTLVAAGAGQKNHKSFCMNPFLRCSKYVYFSFTDAIELQGENGATGYVCYYTIHPPTNAQWNIFIFLIYLLQISTRLNLFEYFQEVFQFYKKNVQDSVYFKNGFGSYTDTNTETRK